MDWSDVGNWFSDLGSDLYDSFVEPLKQVFTGDPSNRLNALGDFLIAPISFGQRRASNLLDYLSDNSGVQNALQGATDVAQAATDFLEGEPQQQELNQLIEQANEFNQSSADLAWQRERQAMQDQMDFIREQRSNAYQVAVQDLKAAGLNPILAYTQGGAPVTAGATASAQAASANTPQYIKYKALDVIASIVGSGMHAASTIAKLLA